MTNMVQPCLVFKIFSDKEFKEVEQMMAELPYEYVSTGDAGEDNS